MVDYVKRLGDQGYTQTGGDSEALESLKSLNTFTGSDINYQISIALSATERLKWMTDQSHPNTADWTGGTYTWRLRVTTLLATTNLIEVILRRVSNDGQTVRASKSSGAISVALTSTGVKSGTIAWNDGTQNPGTRFAADKFEIVFRINNTSSMAAAIGNIGMGLGSGNDEITCPFSETAEASSRKFAIVEITKPVTTTGDQTISPSLDFRAKGAIFLSTNQTAFDTFGDATWESLGFADGNGNSRATAAGTDDNVGTSNSGNARYKNCIVLGTNGTPTLSARASVKEFRENGEFVLNWAVNDASASKIIAILIGGGDIEHLRVGHFIGSAATGNVEHGEPSINPTISIIQPTKGTAIDSSAGGAAFIIGAGLSSTKRWAFGNRHSDATAGNTAHQYISAEDKIIKTTSATSDEAIADLVSSDDDGPTLNWTNAQNDVMNFMCIKGGEWDVGAFNAPTGGATPVAHAVTHTAGKTAIGALFFTNGSAAATATNTAMDYRPSAGAVASTSSRGVMSVHDRRASNPTQTARILKNTKCISIVDAAATATSSTVLHQADLSSFAEGQINLSFDTINATTRQIFWIAMLGAVAVTRNTAALTLINNILERKTGTLTVRNDIRERKTGSLTIRNDIRQRFATTLTLINNRLQRNATTLLTIRNNVNGRVIATLTLINNILERKTSTVTIRNDIRQRLTTTLTLINNILQRNTATLTIRNNIIGRLVSTLRVINNILTRNVTSLTIRNDIRQRNTTTLTIRNDIRQRLVSSTLTVINNILERKASTLTLVNDIQSAAQRLTATLTLVNNILERKTSTVTIRNNINGRLIATLTLVNNIVQRNTTSLLTIRNNILQRLVSSTLTVVNNILERKASTLTIVSDIQSAVQRLVTTLSLINDIVAGEAGIGGGGLGGGGAGSLRTRPVSRLTVPPSRTAVAVVYVKSRGMLKVQKLITTSRVRLLVKINRAPIMIASLPVRPTPIHKPRLFLTKTTGTLRAASLITSSRGRLRARHVKMLVDVVKESKHDKLSRIVNLFKEWSRL